MKPTTLVAVSLALFLTPPAAAQSIDMVAVSWSGTASGIDSATGGGVIIGATGFIQLNNLARHPSTGTFYVLTNNGPARILTLDMTTGVATDTGVTVPINDIRGLAIDPSGTCWAIRNGSPDSLYRLDLSAGTATLIGGTGWSSLQSLTADPVTGRLYVWDVAAGSGPQNLLTVNPMTGLATPVGIPQAPGNDIQTLAFSPTGTLYGVYHQLYTVDTITGAHTLVGSGPWSDVRGAEFFGPPPVPAYAGNGSDVAIEVGVGGAARPGLPGVHSVSAGDVISLAFTSPGGTISLFPFLSLAQLFTTGSPPAQEPVLGLFVDLQLPTVIIADGLTNPGQVFNPILDAYVAVGTLPLPLAGTSTSILVSCVAFDRAFPPFNYGIADAQELRIN